MDEKAATTESWATYLVEGYREGKPVRYVHSTIVPEDESCLFLLEATSESLVREAYARARVQFERISTAIPVEDVVPDRRVRK